MRTYALSCKRKDDNNYLRKQGVANRWERGVEMARVSRDMGGV